jgi:hypothetical protein
MFGVLDYKICKVKRCTRRKEGKDGVRGIEKYKKRENRKERNKEKGVPLPLQISETKSSKQNIRIAL